MRRIFAIASFSIATITSSQLRPLGALAESYSNTVPVSGSMLVGMDVDAPASSVRLEDYGVALPGVKPQQLCLTAKTRDGRYHASRSFQIDTNSAYRGTLNTVSQRPELRRYSTDDLAVKLELRAACDEGRAGVLVPALHVDHAISGTLRTFLNIQFDHAYAALTEKPQQIPAAWTPCKPVTAGTSTAFDHSCSMQIPLQLRGREATLKIRIVDTTGGTSIEQFRVLLPTI